MLGTIAVDHPEGLVGHSDGDVVAHALCDALLSAAGRARHRRALPAGRRPSGPGASGERLLAVVMERVRAGGPARGQRARRGRVRAAAPGARTARPCRRRSPRCSGRRSACTRRPRTAWASPAAARASPARPWPCWSPHERTSLTAPLDPHQAQGAAGSGPGRHRAHLRLRAHGLRPHPHRQRPALRGLLGAEALPRAARHAGEARLEPDRRQRQDLRRRPRGGRARATSSRGATRRPTSPTPTGSAWAARTPSRASPSRSPRSSR